MFEVIKEIPETIKSWTENREQAYAVVASAAAALVGIAFLTGSRPSESLAVVARGLGLSQVADWLTSSAPPLLATREETLSHAALVTALLLLAWMVFVPLLRGRRDDNQMFGYELLPLIGAPSAATIWVLLLIGAQFGDIETPLRAWVKAAFAVGFQTLGGLAMAGVLYLVAKRYGWGGPVRFLLWPATVVVYRVVLGIGFAGFAVVFAATATPLSMVGWFAGLESDRRRKTRAGFDLERLNREPEATGAAVVRAKPIQENEPLHPQAGEARSATLSKMRMYDGAVNRARSSGWTAGAGPIIK